MEETCVLSNDLTQIQCFLTPEIMTIKRETNVCSAESLPGFKLDQDISVRTILLNLNEI